MMTYDTLMTALGDALALSGFGSTVALIILPSARKALTFSQAAFSFLDRKNLQLDSTG